MKSKISRSRLFARGQRGFTIIEVMISMIVMVVGLVSLLAVMGIAMASTQSTEQNAIAKRLANEAIESILTARETDAIQWSNIANGNCAVGTGCTTGIFLPGAQNINLAGADGIIGTSDDAAAGPQILDMPGPTGVIQSPPGGPCAAPDNCVPLTNYQRTIAIAPYNGSTVLNSVTITITYNNPRIPVPQNYVLNTLISQYR